MEEIKELKPGDIVVYNGTKKKELEKRYIILHTGVRNIGTLEPCIVYQCLYGVHDIFVRNESDFFGKTIREGKEVPRFLMDTDSIQLTLRNLPSVSKLFELLGLCEGEVIAEGSRGKVCLNSDMKTNPILAKTFTNNAPVDELQITCCNPIDTINFIDYL